MVDSAGETASEVKVRIRQRSQVLGKEGNFLMGREILAMVLDHFRTSYSIVVTKRWISSSMLGLRSSPT